MVKQGRSIVAAVALRLLFVAHNQVDLLVLAPAAATSTGHCACPPLGRCKHHSILIRMGCGWYPAAGPRLPACCCALVRAWTPAARPAGSAEAAACASHPWNTQPCLVRSASSSYSRFLASASASSSSTAAVSSFRAAGHAGAGMGRRTRLGKRARAGGRTSARQRLRRLWRASTYGGVTGSSVFISAYLPASEASCCCHCLEGCQEEVRQFGTGRCQLPPHLRCTGSRSCMHLASGDGRQCHRRASC